MLVVVVVVGIVVVELWTGCPLALALQQVLASSLVSQMLDTGTETKALASLELASALLGLLELELELKLELLDPETFFTTGLLCSLFRSLAGSRTNWSKIEVEVELGAGLTLPLKTGDLEGAGLEGVLFLREELAFLPSPGLLRREELLLSPSPCISWACNFFSSLIS
jgi:hypothetical protein